MSETTTENLNLVDFVEGQQGAATKLNTNQDTLDVLVQLWVADGTPAAAPPVSGVDNGTTYIVPASATGDWSTHDDELATWQSGWIFRVPQKGVRAWDEANQRLTIWFGDRWQPFQAARVSELTDNTTGSIETSLEPTGTAATNDNDASLNAKINAIMDAMIAVGLMAGDPITKVVDEAVGITEVAVDVLNP